LVVTAAACGGDDAPDRQAYVDEAVKSIQDQEDFEVTDAEAECLAGAVVDTIGVDELDDAGVSPREFGSADSFQDLDLDLGRSTIDDMARRVNDCEIDVSGVFIDSLTGALPGLELSSERRRVSPTSSGTASGSSSSRRRSVARSRRPAIWGRR
jgi:hypothetical protein